MEGQHEKWKGEYPSTKMGSCKGVCPVYVYPEDDGYDLNETYLRIKRYIEATAGRGAEVTISGSVVIIKIAGGIEHVNCHDGPQGGSRY